MSDTPEVLSIIQQGVVDLLVADPYFDDITVLAEDIEDIENKIEIAIGQLGICIVVLTVGADVEHPDVPGPFFDNINVLVRIGETPTLNRADTGTGKRANNVAVKVAKVLAGKVPEGANAPLICLKPTIGPADLGPGVVARQCSFGTSGSSDQEFVFLPAPEISMVDGIATITCATPGAAIFYHTGTGYPSPRSGTFYTTPVAVESGTILKARAWLAGYLPSPLVKITV